MRRLVLAGAIAGAVLALPAPADAQAAACGPRDAPGGEWPVFGRDDANTRHQQHERVISPADVPLLSPAWTFSTTDAGGEGDIVGTPIVTGGCLYAATTHGWVFALNADTGELVWEAQVPEGGGVFGSLGADSKRIFAAVSRTRRGVGCPEGAPCVGPYVVAFDRRNGRIVWSTEPLDSQPGADTFVSPVHFRGVLLAGVSGGAAELGDEADRHAFQGSLVFLATRTGRLLRKTWTIHPPGEPKDEFAGAGIWSTPAIDRVAKVAYAGTANPFRPQVEHEHANAMVKYDLDRRSPTFGQIIGSYKGNIDEYLPAYSQLPCYDVPGNSPPYYPQGLGACGDIDMDFGASPNLFTVGGRKLVGAGQKSGVYHVFDAQTMEPVWTQIVGPPTQFGGVVGSTAYDGESIHGPITAPGYVWSIAAADGTYRWMAPVVDALHWGPPVAAANGVVYTVDLTGFLDAYDARSGALLAKRPLALGGTSSPFSFSWAGVSIARHTIYAAVGVGVLSEGYIVAFRPGGTGDLTADVEKTLADLRRGDGGDGGGGGPATGGAIVAGPGATNTTYATPVMVTQVGGPLSFMNLDLQQHDVTADDVGPDGKPLFASRLGGLGETVPIEGLDRVESGRQYGFFCSIHPGMRGTLIVR